MAEVIKNTSRPIKAAYCMTCERKWHGVNAQAVGYNHAKHHGHEVAVDVTLSYIYDGRSESERAKDVRERGVS